MKNVLKTIIIASMLFFAVNKIYAASGIEFGLFGGVSVPSEKASAIFDPNKILSIDSLKKGTPLSDAASAGYHIGAKLKISLASDIKLVVGAAFHRFNESSIIIKDPTNPEKTLVSLFTTQNVIPISAGLDYTLFSAKLLDLYTSVELDYNAVSYTTDVNFPGIGGVPQTNPFEGTQSRVGFGLGVGTNVNLQILKVNLEAKYHYMNLIGKEDGEADKNFIAVSLGVYF